MACHFNDNVYTKVFTPREYQVELLDSLKERNTIICLANNSTKLFLSVKLVQELAAQVRRWVLWVLPAQALQPVVSRPYDDGGKRTVFILDSSVIPLVSSYIRHLTDLNVAQYLDVTDAKDVTEDGWEEFIRNHHILVLTSDVCLDFVAQGYLSLKHINLLVLDDCRLALKPSNLHQVSITSAFKPFRFRITEFVI